MRSAARRDVKAGDLDEPERARPDRLLPKRQAGSVLRDRGNSANYPAQDRTGAARFAGAAPDLGAYEGP